MQAIPKSLVPKPYISIVYTLSPRYDPVASLVSYKIFGSREQSRPPTFVGYESIKAGYTNDSE